jgi:hypothetical protein
MSEVVGRALGYASKGWPVFPCHWVGPKRKNPLTSHGYLDATIDRARIVWWWSRWPAALIGAATGKKSVVLDVDPRHGGVETLAALGFPKLPRTPTVRTAGGGFHLHFAPPLGREIRNTQGAEGNGIGAGLDWRGVGGYVIVPSPDSGV